LKTLTKKTTKNDIDFLNILWIEQHENLKSLRDYLDLTELYTSLYN
jgi:hypothetical protein